jgi:hypothetical protein
VALGHIGALNDNAVGIRQVTWVDRSGATPQARPQTGDAGAVSDAGLILDRDDPQAAHQLLLDVVPFVV